MTDVYSSDAIIHRVTETEKLLRDTRERQIRTDENVNLLKEGQAQMSRDMEDVLDEIRGIRTDQKQDSRSVSRWVRVAVFLIPVVPTLLHMLGHPK